MLEDFIFSINAVMPLFLMLLLGYSLKRLNFINDGFIQGGNKIVFYIGLPTTLFINVSNTNLYDLLDFNFAALSMSLVIVSFLVIWAISSLYIKEKSILGAFVSGAFRGNFAFLGMPLLFNIAGAAGMARAALIITFVVPFFAVGSVLALTACSGMGEKVRVRTIVLTVVKNPLIIGIFLGLMVLLLDINLPIMITNTLVPIAGTGTPLALLCLGGGMTFHGFDKKFKFAVIASLIKVVVLPILFASVGYFFGFRGYDLAALIVLGGIPSAIGAYVMVVQMGGDAYIAGTIVVISTVMSVVTLTMFVYFMRATGMI